jgi:hypothetical protein
MSLLPKVLSNGFVPLIPILVWNYLFASRLPAVFEPKAFNSGIPLIIISGENIFRAVVFIMPLSFRINLLSSIGKSGLLVFLAGASLYFLSWLMLIYFPDSKWSESFFGFTAPAYTPLIWLVGLGLMADSYYFNLPFSRWYYLLSAVFFTGFHFLHTMHVYRRN